MDVQELHRICPECQGVARHHKHKAPLMPLPVVDQPFERVGIDLVRPLPQTKASHLYVLTMVDYGTRYPEAIPLHQTDSQTIAAELMTIFSRIGVPKKILSDCRANVTSKLIKELYRLLGVQPIQASPYHPQTDGMVERFHYEDKAKKGRDQIRHAVGQSLTIYPLCLPRSADRDDRFQPFEMLYGRKVRGPLDILKETW